MHTVCPSPLPFGSTTSSVQAAQNTRTFVFDRLDFPIYPFGLSVRATQSTPTLFFDWTFPLSGLVEFWVPRALIPSFPTRLSHSSFFSMSLSVRVTQSTWTPPSPLDRFLCFSSILSSVRATQGTYTFLFDWAPIVPG